MTEERGMSVKTARKSCGLLVTMSLLIPAATLAMAQDDAGKSLTALERKLHGEWVGQGPCDGRLTLRADGTYERRLYGPGGINSAGTWKVRWDALPPTLVLTCRTSDGPGEDAGTTYEPKLIQLDDAALAYNFPNATPSRYARKKK
jgi:hypothetical protein